ncbi:MAG TPA: SUF system Fe-S cluster assembly regulator [Rhodanobacteraceae bacterium]|nr:SUF system Fe-S cluster assembly regulator [Rhodanobacteraceae bacterium]
MLRVSRLTDYATLLMTCLAETPAEVASAAQLAERARLEAPTVSKLLKLLGHAGLVESFRGATGGYRLARPAGEISIAEVVEAVDGPIGMTECGIAAGQCDRESWCGVRLNWQDINARVDATLRAVSVADMSRAPAGRDTINIPVSSIARA